MSSSSSDNCLFSSTILNDDNEFFLDPHFCFFAFALLNLSLTFDLVTITSLYDSIFILGSNGSSSSSSSSSSQLDLFTISMDELSLDVPLLLFGENIEVVELDDIESGGLLFVFIIKSEP